MDPDWAQALRAGDVKGLARLLDAGADINALDRYGQTSLMIATRQGHVEVVRLLVDRGATLNHHAKYRITALMQAVISGHLQIVQMLVETGADTAIRGTGAPGFAGKTALDLALAAGRTDVAAVLQGDRS